MPFVTFDLHLVYLRVVKRLHKVRRPGDCSLFAILGLKIVILTPKATRNRLNQADTRGKRGKKVDVLGITSVNFSRLFHTGALPDDEPYIIADEAQQVYYVPDPKNKD